MKQIDLKVLKEIIDYLSDDVVIFLATKDDCIKQNQQQMKLDENTVYLNNPFSPRDENIFKPCGDSFLPLHNSTSSYIDKKSVDVKYFGENNVSTIPLGETTDQTHIVDEIDAILNKPSKLVSDISGK